jgi:hypothetical protein
MTPVKGSAAFESDRFALAKHAARPNFCRHSLRPLDLEDGSHTQDRRITLNFNDFFSATPLGTILASLPSEKILALCIKLAGHL